MALISETILVSIASIGRHLRILLRSSVSQIRALVSSAAARLFRTAALVPSWHSAK